MGEDGALGTADPLRACLRCLRISSKSERGASGGGIYARSVVQPGTPVASPEPDACSLLAAPPPVSRPTRAATAALLTSAGAEEGPGDPTAPVTTARRASARQSVSSSSIVARTLHANSVNEIVSVSRLSRMVRMGRAMLSGASEQSSRRSLCRSPAAMWPRLPSRAAYAETRLSSKAGWPAGDSRMKRIARVSGLDPARTLRK
mmetsp:Transcript_4766/g.15652  ORF Transcript_4766/g.15652 Transcript_4766/m.15652 type:complete len:204 (+) Transcript_4766:485-1096(+)|eukprot:scaffold4142_cov118-Isochrysis_galbana.AAC.4